MLAIEMPCHTPDMPLATTAGGDHTALLPLVATPDDEWLPLHGIWDKAELPTEVEIAPGAAFRQAVFLIFSKTSKVFAFDPRSAVALGTASLIHGAAALRSQPVPPMHFDSSNSLAEIVPGNAQNSLQALEKLETSILRHGVIPSSTFGSNVLQDVALDPLQSPR
jgi:hypothetical protein